MKKVENKYCKQIFVCTNTKKDGTGCGPKGGDLLREKLKEKLHSDLNLVGKARINKSGCMDFCTNGIAVQIQPENKLLLECNVENVDEIWNEFVSI